MKAKKIYLSKIMKAAWTSFRKGGKTFSQALKGAWAWAKQTLTQNTDAFEIYGVDFY